MRSRKFFIVPVVLVVLAGAAFLVFRSTRPSRARNLILITVDALRADHLSCYGYPVTHTSNIAKFAASGLVFDEAFTTLPTTGPAISSIMTSMYPRSHNVRKNGIPLPDSAVTLAEVLKARGWRTAAFVSAFPLDRRFHYGQGFEDYHDSIGARGKPKSLKFESNAEQMTNAVGKWLKKNRERDKVFLWIHYFDPHAPYRPPAKFANVDSPAATPDLRAYDGEIAFMDEQFGILLKKLDSAGMLKNSMIIMASDHGEGFGEHGYHGHGWFLYDEVLRVALIVQAPGIQPGRSARLTQHVDVAPGILDYFGIPIPASFQGRSWWGVNQGTIKPRENIWAERRLPPIPNADTSASDEPEHETAEEKWTVRTAGEKLIWSSDGNDEFFDLRVDPAEKHNLYGSSPADPRIQKLLQLGMALRKNYEKKALAPTHDLQQQDKETRDRLKALGYVD